MTAAADRAEIERLERQRADAIVAADRATLAAMTSDDYVHVDSHGRPRSKADFLAGVDAGGSRFVRYLLLDNDIRVLGDAAMVTGTFENALRAPDGTVAAKRARHVRIYARGPHGWSNLLHQATELKD